MDQSEFARRMCDRVREIKAICTEHGAPFADIVLSTVLTEKERERGYDGLVKLYLSDTEPGWRYRDNRYGRARLRARIRKAILKYGLSIRVRVYSGYSAGSKKGENDEI